MVLHLECTTLSQSKSDDGLLYVPGDMPYCHMELFLHVCLLQPHCLQVKTMSQDIRNDVGSLLLRLTIRELFDWRFMQTDPNWGNFLYDEHSDQLHLIDFGAAKEYPKPFVDDYLRMVLACADKNREELIQRSTKLKFLTGQHLGAMLRCSIAQRCA